MTPTGKALTAKLLLLLSSLVLLGGTLLTWILAGSSGSASTLHKRFPELHGQRDPLYFEVADWVSSHIPPLAITAFLACLLNLAVTVVLIRRHRLEDILEIGGMAGRLVLGGLLGVVFLVMGIGTGPSPLLSALAGFILGAMLPTIWQRASSARNPEQS